MKENVSKVVKLNAMNLKLKEENEKLTKLIQYFRALSVQYEEDISSEIKQNVHVTSFQSPKNENITIIDPIKRDISNTTKINIEDDILTKSPKVTTLHSSTEEVNPITQPRLLKNSWGSKSASALPICFEEQQAVTTTQQNENQSRDSRSEKRSTKRKKSRSPTSRASQLIRKQKPINKSTNEIILSSSKKTEITTQENLKIENVNENHVQIKEKTTSHCIVVIFRPNCYEEQQKFFRFIASYSEIMNNNKSISWYRGLCSIKKQGNGKTHKSHFILLYNNNRFL